VLFENSPDMITVHDTAGNLIDPNPRLCEETGYDEAELTEMKVWDLNVELTPQQATARWAEMETGDRHRIEGIYRRKDGSTFPVEAHVRRLSLEGEDRFVVISRDITERTAREQALEAQNERLDEFASIVSHDLRNPLNVASLRVELASEEFDSDHLEMASDALDRMDGLIEDLLTLARSGDELDVERVSLDEVAHACWTVVETGDANLVVETDRSIRAHEGTLRQLLENLFRNSVEHGSTTPGSQAREDTEPATPDRLARPDASSGADAAPLTRSAAADEQAGSGPTSRDGTGDAVTITVGALDDGFYVEDDGPGIPEDLRDRVFESGYSGEGGTGLGLNIVKRIADAHGWSVRATESAAGGARFEIAGVESGGDDV
jgi:PAS domain S-box-containing protein